MTYRTKFWLAYTVTAVIALICFLVLGWILISDASTLCKGAALATGVYCSAIFYILFTTVIPRVKPWDWNWWEPLFYRKHNKTKK